MKVALAVGGLVTSVFGVGAVFWSEGCTTTPPRHWLTPLEVEARLREVGLRMQSLRTDDDRCFAVVARDRNGGSRAIIVNPASGAIVRNEPQG